MRKFMRQICASKLFRKKDSKQKIHAPPKRKIHAKSHAPKLCVKVVPKMAQNTKSMHPQNETNHARIHALILAPPSSEKSIAHATQLCNRKAGANEKAQPYGHLCSTSLSPRPWGPIPKALGQSELALSQQVRIQSEQQRKNRRALAVKQEEGRPAASAGLRGRFP